jgi:hypothetical protein
MAKPDPEDFVSAKDDVDTATAKATNIPTIRLNGMTDIRSLLCRTGASCLTIQYQQTYSRT